MEYVKTLEEKAVEPNIIDTDPNPTLEQLTQDNEKKRRQYKECKDESKLLKLKIEELETKLKPFERLTKYKRRINDIINVGMEDEDGPIVKRRKNEYGPIRNFYPPFKLKTIPRK
jgi:hypothetical protein